MVSRKLMVKKLLIAPGTGAILSAGILIGCAVDTDTTLRDGQDSDRATLILPNTPVASVGAHAETDHGELRLTLETNSIYELLSVEAGR